MSCSSAPTWDCTSSLTELGVNAPETLLPNSLLAPSHWPSRRAPKVAQKSPMSMPSALSGRPLALAARANAMAPAARERESAKGRPEKPDVDAFGMWTDARRLVSAIQAANRAVVVAAKE